VACPWLITRFIDNQATFIFTALKNINQAVDLFAFSEKSIA